MADLARLRGRRFVVIGRAGMDFYPDPPGAKTERATRFEACLGGSSANIAVALVRLGCAADLVTCVSADAVGRFVLNELDRYGVGRALVRAVGGEARTSLAVVETTLADHQSVIYRNGAADFEMTAADVEAIDCAAYAGMIVTGTALAAEPSRGACFRALERARAAGLPAIIDLDYRPYSWPSGAVAAEVCRRAAALCDVVVGNDVEFGVMAGAHDGGLAAARLLAAGGARIAVYKMGERGAVTFGPEGELATGVFPTRALKPTGAGDSFMGGLVSGLAEGRTLRAAVLRGSAAAAMVVARVGCAPAMPTAEELDAFMRAHAA
jgi:5-dehydro-2-deoxygluconokinase